MIWFFIREEAEGPTLVMSNQQHDYLAVVAWSEEAGDYVFEPLGGGRYGPDVIERALREAREVLPRHTSDAGTDPEPE